MDYAYIDIVSYTGNESTQIGVKRITDKAVLVEVSDGAFDWFPISQVRFILASGGAAVVMPLWMARQKGYSRGRYTKVDMYSVDMAIRQGRASELSINDALIVD